MWRITAPPACSSIRRWEALDWVAGPPATYSVAPAATIAGSKTNLSGPIGIALDSNANIYVADDGVSESTGFPTSVFVYPALGSSTGLLNEVPSAAISTTVTTSLHTPYGIALDSSGNIYVADSGDSAASPRSLPACLSIRRVATAMPPPPPPSAGATPA